MKRLSAAGVHRVFAVSWQPGARHASRRYSYAALLPNRAVPHCPGSQRHAAEIPVDMEPCCYPRVPPHAARYRLFAAALAESIADRKTVQRWQHNVKNDEVIGSSGVPSCWSCRMAFPVMTPSDGSCRAWTRRNSRSALCRGPAP